MSDESQPEYCDCEGFHDGSCRNRRLKMLEELCSDLEESLTRMELRVKILENTCQSVFKCLNDCYNKATIVQISRAGELSDAISHAIQDLDCVLRGEGAKEHKNGK